MNRPIKLTICGGPAHGLALLVGIEHLEAAVELNAEQRDWEGARDGAANGSRSRVHVAGTEYYVAETRAQVIEMWLGALEPRA